MSYRTDRYEIGDMVVPDKNFHSYYVIKDLGDGPFKVSQIIEIPETASWATEQSPRSSVGHVQQIVLEGIRYKNNDDRIFSGAYFQKV